MRRIHVKSSKKCIKSYFLFLLEASWKQNWVKKKKKFKVRLLAYNDPMDERIHSKLFYAPEHFYHRRKIA